jgi:hypothetical protein
VFDGRFGKHDNMKSKAILTGRMDEPRKVELWLSIFIHLHFVKVFPLDCLILLTVFSEPRFGSWMKIIG